MAGLFCFSLSLYILYIYMINVCSFCSLDIWLLLCLQWQFQELCTYTQLKYLTSYVQIYTVYFTIHFGVRIYVCPHQFFLCMSKWPQAWLSLHSVLTQIGRLRMLRRLKTHRMHCPSSSRLGTHVFYPFCVYVLQCLGVVYRTFSSLPL